VKATRVRCERRRPVRHMLVALRDWPSGISPSSNQNLRNNGSQRTDTFSPTIRRCFAPWGATRNSRRIRRLHLPWHVQAVASTEPLCERYRLRARNPSTWPFAFTGFALLERTTPRSSAHR